MRNAAVLLLAALAANSHAGGQQPGQTGTAACAPCHREIAAGYAATGMGRSFYKPRPDQADWIGTYFHAASDEYFRMSQRDGRYFQRRHQIAEDGAGTNIVEKEVHYILGSGNHSRTYLNRTADGEMIELPLAWYAENGGTWAMNPGYDRRDHPEFGRRIDQECFFCHNAHPNGWESPGGGKELRLRGEISLGIDCQRCHGPGLEHVRKAAAGAGRETVRAAIVNPAKWTAPRQLELCLQCHLESTSRALPYAIRRYGRGMFSYRPGEPLENYILHFDHAPGIGFADKFDIAGAGYRLLKSACFEKSNGALQCTTCHNPHRALRGEQAVAGYRRACLGCHTKAHRNAEDCAGCHMPKRRTEDVVHVVMTDHLIQRRNPEGGLADSREEFHETAETAYRGEVVPLYPRTMAMPAADLYRALAQVLDGSNLTAGIPRLQSAIAAAKPREAEFYLELANAYSKAGAHGKAIAQYREALKRNPKLAAAQRGHVTSLIVEGRIEEASTVHDSADAIADAASLNAIGDGWLRLGKPDRAIPYLRRALRAQPEASEVLVNLGAALVAKGMLAEGIENLREAVRITPQSAAANSNLANALRARRNFAEAQRFFRIAIRIEPGNSMMHYNYGLLLLDLQQYAEAEAELTAALNAGPATADAHIALGSVFSQTGRTDQALEQYGRAIQLNPKSTLAHFNLGLALLRRERLAEARPHLEAVLADDPSDDAARLHLGRILLREGNRKPAIGHLERAARSANAEVRAAAEEALRGARE